MPKDSFQEINFIKKPYLNPTLHPKLWMAHPDNPESEKHRLYRALDYMNDSKADEKEIQTKNIEVHP